MWEKELWHNIFRLNDGPALKHSVVKEVISGTGDLVQEAKADLKREVAILQGLDHDNIVKQLSFIGPSIDNPTGCVLDFSNNGCLKDWLQTRRILKPREPEPEYLKPGVGVQNFTEAQEETAPPPPPPRSHESIIPNILMLK